MFSRPLHYVWVTPRPYLTGTESGGGLDTRSAGRLACLSQVAAFRGSLPMLKVLLGVINDRLSHLITPPDPIRICTRGGAVRIPLSNPGYEVLPSPKLAAFATSCSDVNGATSRPQQTTTNAAQLPTTLPSLGPGGVGHGRTSRPCNPVSARRTQGLANASETQKSRLRRPARGFLCRAAAPPGCRCSPQGAWGTVRRRH